MINVLLSCLHNQAVNEPIENGEQFCRRCGDFVTVISKPIMWVVRCKNCIFSRQFGADETTTRRVAQRHLNKHGGHNVQITNGKETYLIFGIQADIPDLLSLSREVQSTLRAHDVNVTKPLPD